MILQKTQLQKDLDEVEKFASYFTNSVSNSIKSLNLSYRKLWGLPEDRLVSVLNELGVEKMIDIFTKHHIAATALNSILDGVGDIGERAIAVAAREIIVNPATGEISLKPIEKIELETNSDGI